MPLSSSQLSAVVHDSLPKLHALGPDAPFLWSSVYSQDVLDDIRSGRFDGRGPVFLEDLGLTAPVEGLLDATENQSVHLWAAVLASRLLFATRDQPLAELLSRRLHETEGWRLGSLSLGISSLSGHLYLDPETSQGRIDLAQFSSAVFNTWRDQALELISRLAGRPRDSAARQELLGHLMELRRELPQETRQNRINAACTLIVSETLSDQLDEHFESGDAPLHLAAEYGLPQVIAVLLGSGANPDVRSKDNALTALMIAARQGDANVVRQLVAAGADVNARDELDNTALLWACSDRALARGGRARHDIESIRLLLEAGSDPFARAATGRTVSHYARLDPELQTLIDRFAGRVPDLRPAGVVCRPDAVPPARRRGVAAFVARQSAGHPEWSLMAAEAPIDDVSQAYTELWQPDVVKRNVARQPVEPAPRLVWLLQLRQTNWSLLIYSLDDYVFGLDAEAGDLSQHLDGRVLSFTGEDTSGIGGLSVFERGERVERLKVELYQDEAAALDEWAVEHGLFVPPCGIDDDGRQVQLELDGIDVESIVRIDTFAFGDYG